MGNHCCTATYDCIEDRKLRHCDGKNVPRFVPDVRRCKVVAVYDGDTITVAARLARRGSPHLFRVRLRGIDSPEMRGSTSDEKQAATLSRDYLRTQILGECITLKNIGTEKYGRLLATVFHRGRDINQLIIDHGHAKPYDGGTKTPFI